MAEEGILKLLQRLEDGLGVGKTIELVMQIDGSGQVRYWDGGVAVFHFATPDNLRDQLLLRVGKEKEDKRVYL